MTLRPPRSSSRTPQVAALDYEIAQEQASALGRLGRALEIALSALAAHDRGQHASDTAHRARLVQDASDALWCFIVQRDSVGLRDPRPVFRQYGVPRDVQNRMGTFRSRHSR